ncbi:hypothetical protein ANDO1_1733 [plant metagenome]|uniref:DUF4224 domain-containing protein n=1 Tax=plant metagenome TaxID=1297885 RepID=A0A484P5E5_9ZZZZ
MMALPYLSDEEVSEICRPLRQAKAQVRYLARLGMNVQRRPDGRALVARSEFERVMAGGTPAANDDGAAEQAAGPDRSALAEFLSKRVRKNGSKA